MPSTYSPNLRIELIATGEQSGTWGNTTNTNLGTLLESAISGYITVNTTAANQALTAVNGGADQSRNMAINLTTSTGANFNVYIPPTPKFYVVRNSSSFTATIFNSTVLGNTTAAGTGVAIPASSTTIVMSDGTNVFSAANYFATATVGTLSLTNALAAAFGGTGQSSYTVGDLLVASGTTSLTKLAGVATGNALISGGVGAAPTYGKIGLTTHVSGTLPVANGGTGVTTSTGSGSVVLSSSPTLTSPTLTTPALSGATVSTSAAVTAGTNAQGQGALTSDFNVVTTAAANPSGVTLPTATVGRTVVVVNRGANPVAVFPATGGAIDGLAANTAITLPVNESLEFTASSTTQWYSSVMEAVSVDALVGTVAASQGGTGQSSYTIGDILFASGTTALSRLAGVATGNALISGGVGAAPSYGKIGLTTHVSGTLPIANGGTNSTATPTDGGIAFGTGTAFAFTAAGSSKQVLQSNGTSNPAWTTLDLTYLPDAAFKKSVKAASTAALTVTATSSTLTNAGTLAALTLDGVTLAVNDRVLIKNQATAAQNGIYDVTTLGDAATAWVLTRPADANTSSEMGGATVNVDQGTQGGTLYTTTFKTTDTIGTTAMNWFSVVDSGTAQTLTNKTLSTGSTWSGNTIAIASGGTGATTAAAARTSLGTVADTAANGIAARTAANTLTARTITAGTGISVTNGDGVSGNPTIANTGVTSVNGSTGAVTVPMGGDYIMRTYTAGATWTKPADLKGVEVTVIAGGGAGGSASGAAGSKTVAAQAGGAGGGGGGGTSVAYIAAASLPATVTVTVGGAGASSSFGTFATATAGANASNAGAGQSDGGAGGSGSTSGVGAGVVFAGANGSGGIGGAIAASLSGAGGASSLGGNAGGRSSTGGGVGAPGYGGGGSGARGTTNTTVYGGGGGAQGVVIVKEFY